MHRFQVMAGYSYQCDEYDGFNANNTNFMSDFYQYNNLSIGEYLKEGKAGMGSYKNSDKFYIKGGDVYIPAIEKSNEFQIDFSKGINCYIYDRMKLAKLCGYLLGVEKYEEKHF